MVPGRPYHVAVARCGQLPVPFWGSLEPFHIICVAVAVVRLRGAPFDVARAEIAALFGAKERFMEFLNPLIARYFAPVQAMLRDLSDCPPSKIRRCDKIGQTVDAKMGRILVRNEPGNSIEPLVAPIEGELIVHKPGKGAFYNTNLEFQLQRRGIETLIFTGVTTEVCVQTSMREANDRGFECIVADDATESYFPEFKKACLEMISSQNGIVGWRCLTEDVVNALKI